jgi:hypothetical protein
MTRDRVVEEQVALAARERPRDGFGIVQPRTSAISSRSDSGCRARLSYDVNGDGKGSVTRQLHGTGRV